MGQVDAIKRRNLPKTLGVPNQQTAYKYPYHSTKEQKKQRGYIILDISIVSAIVGGFIGIGGTFLGYKLARNANLELIKITESSEASAKLRAVFAPAKAHLKFPQSLGNTEAKDFFESAFTNHAIAIEEFRPFAKDNATYQKAWDDYQNTVYGDDALGDAQLKWDSGMITSKDGKENLDFLKVIEGKIDNIIHFATSK